MQDRKPVKGQVAIRLSDADLAELRRRAEQEDRTLTAEVRRIVRRGLAEGAAAR